MRTTALTVGREWTVRNMSEYIKKEDAIASIQAHDPVPEARGGREWAEYLLEDVMSADVVEVVRCKDCKWWDGIECQTRDIDVVDDDDYCSYGEREDGEEDERK